ncbi:LacI family DNA-binding transcriptional regulator [Phytoactinopolyspora halotolerans]|uniref:LacI family transcriptional regulator n=1 Tax=Phytoactinopolyspora halotolerans TaxID=1981512 RepID=A0A6L9S8P0_9ACTN|nr:LacI family DNA-binding transcriptional regulator [Phytoactinopolyspora halotolerans]NEE00962.1 LacI family transcriptional regulator [Phytoactinopolyspora halotolerans]
MAASSRPTIHEVAKAAGVSISSVSRALNGNTSNPEMVARVKAAVKQVGYVPSAVAQSLKTQQTGQVAFAMEDIGNAAYLAMVREIQPLLREDGYRLLLHATGADVQDEIEVLESLAQKYVDGLILCPIRVTDRHLAALRSPAVPVVVIGQLPEEADVDNVRTDSRQGARLAVEHLYAAGARRIAFINGPADTVPGRLRHAGYQDGLHACGLEVDDSLVEFGGFQVSAGREAAQRLLARTQPDAVFAANDLIALGAMHAIRSAGRSIPEEIQVVGMDDTTLAETSFPPLTSVSLGSRDRGRLAADMLLARLHGETGPARRATVAPSLTVRESTREAAA